MLTDILYTLCFPPDIPKDKTVRKSSNVWTLSYDLMQAVLAATSGSDGRETGEVAKVDDSLTRCASTFPSIHSPHSF
jgi:hypothetical protein